MGRLDSGGRLVAADPPLEALQREAGGALGKPLLVPQLAAAAKRASTLRTQIFRPVHAATDAHDLELWTRFTPTDNGVEILIERWIERPIAAPRLAQLLGSQVAVVVESDATWSINEALEIVSVSPQFCQYLDVAEEELRGQPLTKVLRLEENEDGEMPLLKALASRLPFEKQLARSRSGSGTLVLRGNIAIGLNGEFAGFTGSAEREGDADSGALAPSFDRILDEALRSPLDRIVEQAEHIVEQADGPLQPDYASYGSDIASAARHLLSVISSMSEHPSGNSNVVDLAELAEEAVVMLETPAEERRIAVQLQASRRLRARGDHRAVVQILVNLIGNAIRHSPEGSRIDLSFMRNAGLVCVSVQDQGAGIHPGDEQRIFERFERGTDDERGTGLGLAIARRLARSMGGDVTLDQQAARGARFTLSLPEG
jgi:signal transduction histidine kinase